jgi:hypothetical protein
MVEPLSAKSWTELLAAIAAFKRAETIDQLVDMVRETARKILQADGITVVRRIGNRVHYVAEDAMSPLWTGQDFPIERCVSGLAMLTQEPVLISNVMLDPRVPHELYAKTFARSMAMFPVGIGTPTAAIGAYWSRTGRIPDETIALLETLSRAMAGVLYNIDTVDLVENYRTGERRAWGG